MELSEYISIIKDVVIAFVGLATAYVAITGLNKWQKELRGKIYFDTARDLIRTVYKFRDNMSYTRNGFILPSEFPKDYDPLSFDNKKKAEGLSYVYTNRMKPLVEVAQELDLYTLEAEALWGKDIKNRSKKLRSTFFSLQRSIQTDIDDIYSGREHSGNDPEFKKEIRKNIYESSKQDDPLSKEINKAINDIEEIIRPYLDKNL